MSTWLQDIEARDPKLADAWRIVGNQPRSCLRNMVRALKMMPALNTPEDEKRLAAAQRILRASPRKPASSLRPSTMSTGPRKTRPTNFPGSTTARLPRAAGSAL